MEKPEVIAELGINFVNPDGSILSNMPDIIAKLAKDADMIKFQHFYADTLIKEDMPAFTPNKGDEALLQRDITRKREIPFEKQKWFKELCEKNGVQYLCTPMGARTLDELLEIGQTTIKIASGDCGNVQFLQDLVDRDSQIRRIILSTGMSDFVEVSETMEILRRGSFRVDVLQCTSIYPAPLDHTNLNIIKQYKSKYGASSTIGFSDHTLGTEAAVVARALGAEIFEKHVTPDPNMEGPDHKASMPIDDFPEYVSAICQVDRLFGLDSKIVSWAEKKSRSCMKKGIWINRDLPAGHELTRDDVIICRPYEGTTTALLYNEIIGRKLKVAKNKNDGIEESEVWLKSG